MAKLDATTYGEYVVAATPAAKAQVVVDALSGTVTARIRNGASPDAIMATATMAAPWATQVDGVVTVGELAAALSVATGGTPNANWYLEFTNGTRWVTATFGLAGEGREFSWSLTSFAVGQSATLGTVRLTSVSNSAPQWSGAPPSLALTIGGAGHDMSAYASDLDDDPLTFSLGATYTGYSITPQGVLSVGTGATSRTVVVRVSDGTLSSDWPVAVTVNVPTGRKWNPGHYVQFYKTTFAQRQSYYAASDIASNANLEGVMVAYYWRDLETSKGVYNDAPVLADLAALRALAVPKRFCLYIFDSQYNQNAVATLFPAYLASELAADGGPKAYYDGQHTRWAKFDQGAMSDFIRLVQHFGDLLDGEPDVEMFRPFVESTMAGTRYVAAGEAAYRTQLGRLGAAIQQYWPNTLGYIPFNWEPYSSMGTAMTTAMGYGMGFGAPDTVPFSGDPGYQRADRFIMGELGGYDYRGQVAVIKGIEDSELGYNSVGAVGGYTAQQLWTFCDQTMHASHILWPRNVSVGTNDQRWYDAGTTNPGGILDVINGEAFTYSGRPANWTT